MKQHGEKSWSEKVGGRNNCKTERQREKEREIEHRPHWKQKALSYHLVLSESHSLPSSG